MTFPVSSLFPENHKLISTHIIPSTLHFMYMFPTQQTELL